MSKNQQFARTQPSQLDHLLLEAAREELDETGLPTFSLRAVARRVGVSHQAAAHHFDDRAGLLTALAAIGFGELGEAIGAAVEEASKAPANPGEPVAAVGIAYVHFARRERPLFDLMFADHTINPEDPDLIAQRLSVWKRLVDTIVDAAATGWGAGEDPGVIALAAWASAHGMAILTQGPMAGLTEAIGPDEVLKKLANAVRIDPE